jgi:hypothetical protein
MVIDVIVRAIPAVSRYAHAAAASKHRPPIGRSLEVAIIGDLAYVSVLAARRFAAAYGSSMISAHRGSGGAS